MSVGLDARAAREVSGDPVPPCAIYAVGMTSLPIDRGLDSGGFIRREGAVGLVQPPFAEVVERYVESVREAFGPGLHSIYLYGSLPRGTARIGSSDLDGQVLLCRQPTSLDRQTVAALEAELGDQHPEVSVVEILLDSVDELTHPAERFDGGFHLRVLCTPLWGPDAGAQVTPHRPDLDLARGVQTGWRAAIGRWQKDAAATATRHTSAGPAAITDNTAKVSRGTGRRLARVAFSWVMPRWGGWSSDPTVMAAVVQHFEPGWAEAMATSVQLGWGGPEAADLDAARDLLTGWAVELTARGKELGV